MKEMVESKEKDRAHAQHLAERYHYEFVELKGVHLDLELFHSIQVDLMFRYNFVPLRVEGSSLVVAMADPSDLVVRIHQQPCGRGGAYPVPVDSAHRLHRS